MDDVARGELFELYGMLLAGVSAVRRMLERAQDGSRPAERGPTGPVRSRHDEPPDGDPPARGHRRARTAEDARGAVRGEPPGPDPVPVPALAAVTDRAEVVASVERMRQAMLEALFVLDFVVVHRRLDALMVGRVRTAVVGGIDSADACLAEEAAAGGP